MKKRIVTALVSGLLALSLGGNAFAKETISKVARNPKEIKRALTDKCFGKRALKRAECVHQFRKNKNVGKKVIYDRTQPKSSGSSSSAASTSSSSSSSSTSSSSSSK